MGSVYSKLWKFSLYIVYIFKKTWIFYLNFDTLIKSLAETFSHPYAQI